VATLLVIHAPLEFIVFVYGTVKVSFLESIVIVAGISESFPTLSRTAIPVTGSKNLGGTVILQI
jgi:hypothetical protein